MTERAKTNPELPSTINRTYIDQANYWLTFFPSVDFSSCALLHLDNFTFLFIDFVDS